MALQICSHTRIKQILVLIFVPGFIRSKKSARDSERRRARFPALPGPRRQRQAKRARSLRGYI